MRICYNYSNHYLNIYDLLHFDNTDAFNIFIGVNDPSYSV